MNGKKGVLETLTLCNAEEAKEKPNKAQEASEKVVLTKRQLERIEKNRQKALALKKARLATNPSIVSQACIEQTCKVPAKPQNTGGGFLLEADEDVTTRVIRLPPAPPALEDRPHCEDCGVEFIDSFLNTHFDLMICDSCRDTDGKHKLIAKTEAKKEYLLKDCDFDKREPPLKFIVKRNPHYSRGDMKLYLKSQVEERALLVWESEENLDAAREQRSEDREKRRIKAYDKKIKALRMTVRSSLYRKQDTSHKHEYGEERFKEEEDEYEKVCKTCGHILTYEKM